MHSDAMFRVLRPMSTASVGGAGRARRFAVAPARVQGGGDVLFAIEGRIEDA